MRVVFSAVVLVAVRPGTWVLQRGIQGPGLGAQQRQELETTVEERLVPTLFVSRVLSYGDEDSSIQGVDGSAKIVDREGQIRPIRKLFNDIF